MATTTSTQLKPRLKNLDDLFQLNGGVNPLDQDTPIERQGVKRTQSVMAINELTPFRKHPFRLYEGERLNDMVDSIKKSGVLVPIIVRQVDSLFEILSGHNRVNAAKLAGLDTVPIILLENISDDVAWVYVIETNLMQRSFSDMAHSEKAAVIALHHSKLFSQGKRNDILAELEILEKPHDNSDSGTSAQIEQKLYSRELIAKEYSLDRNTVARYLRIHRLSQVIKDRLDNGGIGFIPSVTLSFLQESEQVELDKCMGLNNFKVDMKKADVLRQYSEDGKLDEDAIYLILSGEAVKKPKPNRTPVVKVNKTVYAKYFRPEQSATDIQRIVEKALDMYFEMGGDFVDGHDYE